MEEKLEDPSLPLGIISTNCYIVTDKASGKSLIIDPGLYCDDLTAAIAARGIKSFEYILLTHGHFDHILGVPEVRRIYGGQIAIHSADAECLSDEKRSLVDQSSPRQKQTFIKPDICLKDGSVITLGESVFTVMHTPGHTAGSVCYICGDIIFSGDTLFRMTYGRTDFPGSSFDDIAASLIRLASLPGDYTVYPGHSIPTTMSFERTHNRYLRRHYDGNN